MYPEQQAQSAEQSEVWRDEVSSRIEHYRERRRTGKTNRSMHLDFDALGPEAYVSAATRAAERASKREVCDTNYYRRMNAERIAAAAAAAAAEKARQEAEQAAAEAAARAAFLASAGGAAAAVAPALEKSTASAELEPTFDSATVAIEDEPLDPVFSSEIESPVIAAEPEPEPPSKVIPQSKVIIFPRPIIEPPLAPMQRRDELAEPVFHAPRILDVPEDIVPTINGPLFADIRLDSDVQDQPSSSREPQIEVPLQVAMVAQRVSAGIMDGLIALAGSACFAAFGWNTLMALPHTKPFAAAAVVVPLAFWAIYQFLFLTYAGQTVGMHMNRLRITSFDGHAPSFRDRRRRAIYTVLSCVSIGLGFAWALIDEDSLCWHDRITHTFVRQEK